MIEGILKLSVFSLFHFLLLNCYLILHLFMGLGYCSVDSFLQSFKEMVFCLVGCNVLFNSFTCLNLLSFFISNLMGGR